MLKCVMAPDQGSNLQGWLLAIASGLACCVGASAVFSDLFFPKLNYLRPKQKATFMVVSFALGSGVLLFSSFFTLLHESKKHFLISNISKDHSGLYMLVFYFLGVIGSALINHLIHHFVTGETFHSHHHHFPSNETSILKNSKMNNLNIVDDYGENSPLLKNTLNERTTNISKDNYCNLQNIRDRNEADSSDRSNNIFVVDCNVDESISSDQTDNNESDIHDQKLMQIGIQTALAISIHKFPEGLITFVSSQVSRSLGLALFVAIALHNIIEGLTIALPIYIATRSRIKAFLYASILGGFSQPLGALIGWLFLNDSTFGCWNHNFIYGALFSATSGLMCVICINGMLPQAIKHDTKDGQLVSIFFFLGVFFMGISSALFDQSS